MRKTPFFSIVIPTLNEEKYLPSLLADLTDQTYNDFEIIHIDAASDDTTVAAAKKFRRRMRLATRVVHQRNVAFQRNMGGKMARGQWIIFMDADNRLPRYFLQGLRYQIDKHETVDLFTTWIRVDEQTALKKNMELAFNLGYELYSLIGKDAAVGALIGVRKKIFDRIQFSETEQIMEDSFFVQDCIGAGYHFEIFKEPKYIFSLRRVRKEGSLKIMRVVAAASLSYILGKHFENENHGYVMKGGTYYDQPVQSPLANLQRFVQKASVKQLQKAKKTLKILQEWEL